MTLQRQHDVLFARRTSKSARLVPKVLNSTEGRRNAWRMLRRSNKTRRQERTPPCSRTFVGETLPYPLPLILRGKSKGMKSRAPPEFWSATERQPKRHQGHTHLTQTKIAKVKAKTQTRAQTETLSQTSNSTSTMLGTETSHLPGQQSRSGSRLGGANQGMSHGRGAQHQLEYRKARRTKTEPCVKMRVHKA